MGHCPRLPSSFFEYNGCRKTETARKGYHPVRTWPERIQMKLDFVPRACPLCGGEDARVMVEATLDETKLTGPPSPLANYPNTCTPGWSSASYAVCSTPIRSATGGTGRAYKEASFDSGAESRLAAEPTARFLLPIWTYYRIERALSI